MSEFAIIKNAPLVSSRSNNGSAPIYPFAKMQVGDAFDAPRRGPNTRGVDLAQNCIGSSARGYALRNNPTAKFTVRLLDEKTVRCWRIA